MRRSTGRCDVLGARANVRFPGRIPIHGLPRLRITLLARGARPRPLLPAALLRVRQRSRGPVAPTFIPTERGLRALIASLGARVERVVYDSGPFQFWGSEWYRTGGTLDDVLASPLAMLSQQLAGELRYGQRARARNRAGTDDQAAFFVRRDREQGLTTPGLRAAATPTRSVILPSTQPSGSQ